MKQNRKITHAFRLLDEILTQHTASPLSLNPHKTFATSFVELGSSIAEKTCDIQLINSLSNTLERMLRAMLHNFPENIFWDFDFIVSSMLKQALVAEASAVSFVESFGDKIVSLMELFGSQSEIRFRYVHDFIFGFDWAKWVQNEAQTRAVIEPFSLTFLDCLISKGKGILQLIRVGDARYHQLREQCYRNPFCFSREPEDEQRLLTYLAAQQLIPVPAWNWNARPVWNKPFHQLREQLSLKLNIPKNS
ncbi:hypothetical protein SAMD00079811_41320 [Scytonema sp. HK-05]|uniref:hypothetical protein n=1 Tax=Scytonema sp. HK-05 TaxID=1137095 RepID=UPI000937E029|nr:hypothetical protein [Scytonema sp. HK-05]OKH57174.1 hypothetical protein NIES2130_21485 [Scytonema sp. HK-05]BAY46520.1 hypothetical protein SAMD00079811_41320 [Scytonema sp. HK-05]